MLGYNIENKTYNIKLLVKITLGNKIIRCGYNRVFFSGECIIILVKSFCLGPFLEAVYGVCILHRDVVLHYVEI
jgi:hypothetical protein